MKSRDKVITFKCLPPGLPLVTLADAALTREYFRRVHELQDARGPQNEGPLKKLVARVARGVKLFRYASRHIVGAEIQRIGRNPLLARCCR
jgi:hypothetical protein